MLDRDSALKIVKEKFPDKKILSSAELDDVFIFDVRLFTPENEFEFGDTKEVSVNKETGEIENFAMGLVFELFFPDKYEQMKATIINYQEDSGV